jgi:hypothetical protein
MGLGSHRTLLTGVKGRCWEATFHAAQEDVVGEKFATFRLWICCFTICLCISPDLDGYRAQKNEILAHIQGLGFAVHGLGS